MSTGEGCLTHPSSPGGLHPSNVTTVPGFLRIGNGRVAVWESHPVQGSAFDSEISWNFYASFLPHFRDVVWHCRSVTPQMIPASAGLFLRSWFCSLNSGKLHKLTLTKPLFLERWLVVILSWWHLIWPSSLKWLEWCFCLMRCCFRCLHAWLTDCTFAIHAANPLTYASWHHMPQMQQSSQADLSWWWICPEQSNKVLYARLSTKEGQRRSVLEACSLFKYMHYIIIYYLGGGFKCCLFSPLLGEMIQFD